MVPVVKQTNKNRKWKRQERAGVSPLSLNTSEVIKWDYWLVVFWAWENWLSLMWQRILRLDRKGINKLSSASKMIKARKLWDLLQWSPRTVWKNICWDNLNLSVIGVETGPNTHSFYAHFMFFFLTLLQCKKTWKQTYEDQCLPSIPIQKQTKPSNKQKLTGKLLIHFYQFSACYKYFCIVLHCIFAA